MSKWQDGEKDSKKKEIKAIETALTINKQQIAAIMIAQLPRTILSKKIANSSSEINNFNPKSNNFKKKSRIFHPIKKNTNHQTTTKKRMTATIRSNSKRSNKTKKIYKNCKCKDTTLKKCKKILLNGVTNLSA